MRKGDSINGAVVNLRPKIIEVILNLIGIAKIEADHIYIIKEIISSRIQNNAQFQRAAKSVFG